MSVETLCFAAPIGGGYYCAARLAAGALDAGSQALLMFASFFTASGLSYLKQTRLSFTVIETLISTFLPKSRSRRSRVHNGVIVAPFHRHGTFSIRMLVRQNYGFWCQRRWG